MRVVALLLVLAAAMVPLLIVAAALWKSARWETHVADALDVVAGPDAELDALVDGRIPRHPAQPPRETLT